MHTCHDGTNIFLLAVQLSHKAVKPCKTPFFWTASKEFQRLRGWDFFPGDWKPQRELSLLDALLHTFCCWLPNSLAPGGTMWNDAQLHGLIWAPCRWYFKQSHDISRQLNRCKLQVYHKYHQTHTPKKCRDMSGLVQYLRILLEQSLLLLFNPSTKFNKSKQKHMVQCKNEDPWLPTTFCWGMLRL